MRCISGTTPNFCFFFTFRVVWGQRAARYPHPRPPSSKEPPQELDGKVNPSRHNDYEKGILTGLLVNIICKEHFQKQRTGHLTFLHNMKPDSTVKRHIYHPNTANDS
jgi:hypothetical protein